MELEERRPSRPRISTRSNEANEENGNNIFLKKPIQLPFYFIGSVTPFRDPWSRWPPVAGASQWDIA